MQSQSPDNSRSEMVSDSRLSRLIEEAIMEDLGMGDLTTDAIVVPDLPGHGDILAKEAGTIAGLEIASLVFQYIDHDLRFNQVVTDGSRVDAGTVVATVDGAIASILKAERTALNILQRMSGIATITRKFVEAIKGTRAHITDTRKTAPGIRVLDKLAVRMGGGVNHRFGLDDMVLIKDNHIAAAGGIDHAIEQCLSYLRKNHHQVKVEVETTTLAEVRRALGHEGLDRIMLDNFGVQEMRDAVALINHAVEVEASGNVSLENVRSIAETGVDFVSVGALTHSPKALDISLSLVPSLPRRP